MSVVCEELKDGHLDWREKRGRGSNVQVGQCFKRGTKEFLFYPRGNKKAEESQGQIHA